MNWNRYDRASPGHGDPAPDYHWSSTCGTWEAMLLHPPIDVVRFARAWRCVEVWSARLVVEPGDDVGAPSDVPPEVRDNVDGLHSGTGSDYLDGRVDLPFRSVPGRPQGQLLVWFWSDRTQLIVPEGYRVTGWLDRDLDNFFAYRALILALGEVLGAKGFYWGAEADHIVRVEQGVPLEYLYLHDDLARHIQDGLVEYDGDVLELRMHRFESWWKARERTGHA